MPIDYSSYINPKLLLVVSLCLTLNRRASGVPQDCGVTDYNLLCRWLMSEEDIDREVETTMTDMNVEYWTYIDFALPYTLNCKRAYVQMHLTYYKYINMKEYFHEYQVLKQLITNG